MKRQYQSSHRRNPLGISFILFYFILLFITVLTISIAYLIIIIHDLAAIEEIREIFFIYIISISAQYFDNLIKTFILIMPLSKNLAQYIFFI